MSEVNEIYMDFYIRKLLREKEVFVSDRFKRERTASQCRS